MSDASQGLIIKALDGLAARETATAQNIANAGTPAWRPLRVTFEQALARAAGQGSQAVSGVTPHWVRASAAEGDMRLDLELATAAGTADRYKALIDILDRQLQLQRLAISGNS